jgi:electron transfer flavoprotein beta subunit
MGIKRARSKEVRQIVAADLGVDLAPAASIDRLYQPERTKQTQLIDGTPAEAAAKLVEKLRFEARAL